MSVPDLFTGADPAAQATVRAFCGWHIAPVITETVTLDGPGGTVLMLPTTHLMAIVDVVNDTYPLLDADIEWSQAGVVRHWWWTPRMRAITATITHGFDTCPPEVQAVVERIAQQQRMITGGITRVGHVTVGAPDIGPDGVDSYCRAILTRYKCS